MWLKLHKQIRNGLSYDGACLYIEREHLEKGVEHDEKEGVILSVIVIFDLFFQIVLDNTLNYTLLMMFVYLIVLF